MKQIMFVLVFLFSVSVFGQGLSSGLKAKNSGNEAYLKGDFVTAINNWEKYLISGEKGVKDDVNTKVLYVSSFKYAASDFLKKMNYQSAFTYYERYIAKVGTEAKIDEATVFNMAFSARKSNKNDVAFNYFQKSIDLGYKVDVCKLYLADIYGDFKEYSKMEEILVAAIAQHPDSKYLTQMALMLKIPLLRDASLPFNLANEMAKAASVCTPEEYPVKMGIACDKFQESIPLFEKVLKYIPQNEEAIKCLRICRNSIESFNEYKANQIKE
jgi:tetratricopeptide (TPR) repeat protein